MREALPSTSRPEKPTPVFSPSAHSGCSDLTLSPIMESTPRDDTGCRSHAGPALVLLWLRAKDGGLPTWVIKLRALLPPWLGMRGLEARPTVRTESAASAVKNGAEDPRPSLPSPLSLWASSRPRGGAPPHPVGPPWFLRRGESWKALITDCRKWEGSCRRPELRGQMAPEMSKL